MLDSVLKDGHTTAVANTQSGEIWATMSDCRAMKWALAYSIVEEGHEPDDFVIESVDQRAVDYIRAYLYKLQKYSENKLEVMGFFVDETEEPSASTVFVAFKADQEYQCYCPIGQHGSLDPAYLEGCRRITLEEYKKYSSGLYTPKDYLSGRFEQ